MHKGRKRDEGIRKRRAERLDEFHLRWEVELHVSIDMKK